MNVSFQQFLRHGEIDAELTTGHGGEKVGHLEGNGRSQGSRSGESDESTGDLHCD